MFSWAEVLVRSGRFGRSCAVDCCHVRFAGRAQGKFVGALENGKFRSDRDLSGGRGHGQPSSGCGRDYCGTSIFYFGVDYDRWSCFVAGRWGYLYVVLSMGVAACGGGLERDPSGRGCPDGSEPWPAGALGAGGGGGVNVPQGAGVGGFVALPRA